ncbi:hypothetical protein J3F84DRAFT_175158 [Trichoderma pleuroticola]
MSSGFRHVAIALLSILIWICGETLLAAVVSSPACLTNRRLAISKAHVLLALGRHPSGQAGFVVEGKFKHGGNFVRGLAAVSGFGCHYPSLCALLSSLAVGELSVVCVGS